MMRTKDNNNAQKESLLILFDHHMTGIIKNKHFLFNFNLLCCDDHLSWLTKFSSFSSLQQRPTYIPEIIPSADQLNNTNKAVLEILFFNRVPKVGSQTFMELMKHLSYINSFHFHRDPVQRVEMIRLSMLQQYDLASAISNLAPPAAFVKHVCYTNFTR